MPKSDGAPGGFTNSREGFRDELFKNLSFRFAQLFVRLLNPAFEFFTLLSISSERLSLHLLQSAPQRVGCFTNTLLKLLCLIVQLSVGKFLKFGFQFVDLAHKRTNALDLAIVLRSDDLFN